MDTSLIPNAGDWSAAKIAVCVVFGVIGYVTLSYGQKNRYIRTTIIGIALMAYPYFVSGTPALYGVGITLTALAFIWRD